MHVAYIVNTAFPNSSKEERSQALVSAAPVPCVCKERNFETGTNCTAAGQDNRFLNAFRQEIVRGSVLSCARVGLVGVAMCGVLERDVGDYGQ